MIKKFDEFVFDLENQKQENIEEGKLKNIILATSIASNLMFGYKFLEKHPEENTSINTEQVDSLDKKTDFVDDVDNYRKYYPSDEILEYIKNTEGWHQGWVDDGKGNLTTGWGFKITKELKRKYPNGMTKEQANTYFKEVAIPERVKDFKESVPNINKYSQRQLDALFDLFYNVGVTKFTKGSPNLQLALKNKDVKKIIKNMDHGYNDAKLPGLKIRRDFERDLFMQDVNDIS